VQILQVGSEATQYRPNVNGGLRLTATDVAVLLILKALSGVMALNSGRRPGATGPCIQAKSTETYADRTRRLGDSGSPDWRSQCLYVFYRVYYSLPESDLVVLLLAGRKKSQGRDVPLAIRYLKDFEKGR